MTDPKSWEGEWKMTKRWNRVDDDITEAECLPDSERSHPEHVFELTDPLRTVGL